MKKRRGLPPQAVSPDLLAWAAVVDATRLSERAAIDMEYYLKKYRRMTPLARREIAFRLVAVIEEQVTPPPPASVAPLDIFAVVVAARRQQLGSG